MTCSGRCNRNPCACDIVSLPYYEDPCFQENQCEGVQVINQFSPVIRVPTEWAVPLASNILTLKVAALADMLIGSVIWNPEYGAYLVVAYDQEGQEIKVIKAIGNEVEVGTVIPSCTKFLVTGNPYANIPHPGYFNDFTPNPFGTLGGGNLTNVEINYAEYFVVGEQVSITISFTFEIEGDTLLDINIELPEESFPGSQPAMNQVVPCVLTLGGVTEIGKLTIRAGQIYARITRANGSAMAINTDCAFSANFFYRKDS